jgi:hypothetical protein
MRPAAASTRAATAQWIDGSSPEHDPFDDGGDGDDGGPDGGHKLSKSERKRLRKLKAQNRAA